MARYTDKTETTREQIAEFADSLRKIAAMIDGNVEMMDRHGINSIQATHGPTREESVQKLLKVCGAFQVAIAECSFQPKSLKTEQKRK